MVSQMCGVASHISAQSSIMFIYLCVKFFYRVLNKIDSSLNTEYPGWHAAANTAAKEVTRKRVIIIDR